MIFHKNRCKLLSLIFLLNVFSFIHAQEDTHQRFTLMGLGDSITEGGDTFSSYLFPLWEKLFTGGYLVDFIGPQKQACRIGELHHAGYSGKTVEYLESVIDSLYREYPADIVLLHAGHNHFVEENPIPEMIKAYRSIIGKIKTIRPDAIILLAQVIESGKLPKYSYIPDLNKEIAKLVASYDNPQIKLVNQAAGFDWKEDTVADKVHPNTQGASKMAQSWYHALEKILPVPSQKFYPEIVPYKIVDGDTLSMHIFKPQPSRNNSLSPVIVYFFGGGWKLGTPLQFYRECAYYASLGMTAVTVDYRIEFLHHTTPDESLDDARDAICFLREQADAWHIDPDRIAASGASAGGYLAAAAGLEECNDKACSSPNLLVLNYAVLERIKTLKNHPPPILFLVGSADHLVPLDAVSNFQQKVQQQNGLFELHLFEGAQHPIFLYRKDPDANFYKVRNLTDIFLKQYGYLH